MSVLAMSSLLEVRGLKMSWSPPSCFCSKVARIRNAMAASPLDLAEELRAKKAPAALLVK